MSKTLRSFATVTVTVEIECGPYGTDVRMDQVHRQAGEEATKKVTEALRASSIYAKREDAKVTSVTVREER